MPQFPRDQRTKACGDHLLDKGQGPGLQAAAAPPPGPVSGHTSTILIPSAPSSQRDAVPLRGKARGPFKKKGGGAVWTRSPGRAAAPIAEPRAGPRLQPPRGAQPAPSAAPPAPARPRHFSFAAAGRSLRPAELARGRGDQGSPGKGAGMP